MDATETNARKAAYLARHPQAAQEAAIDVPAIVAAVRAAGALEVRLDTIGWADFDAFVARTDYPTRYPPYIKEFGSGTTLLFKALEHFLSFVLLAPRPGEIAIDVAASNSPCADIVLREFGAARAYRQDFNYPAGVHDTKIGSRASAIPLPDASVDLIMLHNSWEHFEGDEDIAFLFEARRLLKPGGRLVIIPVYMSTRMEIWTSPSVWETKYRAAPQTPAFDPRATVVVKEDIRQRQHKYFDAATLVADAGHVRGLRFEFVHFTNSTDRPYTNPFALRARREA